MALPTTFHLKQADTIIATLSNCAPSQREMFWLTGDLQRFDGFAPVEALIQQASSTVDDDEMETFDAIYAQIHQMGVQLVDAETGEPFEMFIIHIDGDHAELRYA